MFTKDGPRQRSRQVLPGFQRYGIQRRQQLLFGA
jgi:hypothetical protein